MSSGLYDIREVARRTGLPLPKVRYYATVNQQELRPLRTWDGQWLFTDGQARALAVLAGYVGAEPPVFSGAGDTDEDDRGHVAGHAPAGDAGAPARPAQASPAPGGQQSQAAASQTSGQQGPPVSSQAGEQQAQPGSRRRGEAPEATGNGRDLLADLPGEIGTLRARIDDLAEHIADLAEETKQLQVLLTYILEFLAAAPPGPGGPTIPRPQTSAAAFGEGSQPDRDRPGAPARAARPLSGANGPAPASEGTIVHPAPWQPAEL